MKSAWIPACDAPKGDVNISSWIDIKKITRELNDNEATIDYSCTVTSKKLTNCQKIILYPTSEQGIIIKNWIEMSRIMYNAVIDILDPVIFDKYNRIVKDYLKYLKMDYIRPRMKRIKKEIIKFSGDAKIAAHSLDQVGRKCIGMYKSSIRNVERREFIAKQRAEHKEKAIRMKEEKERKRQQEAREKREAKLKETGRKIESKRVRNVKKSKSETTKAIKSESKVNNKKPIMKTQQKADNKADTKKIDNKANIKKTDNKADSKKTDNKADTKKAEEIPEKPFVMKPIGPNKRVKWMIVEGQSISLLKNAIFVTQLGKMKTSTKIPRARTSELFYDTCTNIYTLAVPRDVQPKQFQTRNLTCGIDPGIKTFLTLYSEEETYEIGHEIDFERYFKKIDAIHYLYNTGKYTKAKYKKRLAKVNGKLQRKVRDMHFKVAKMLCTKYNVIKIGVLNVKSIMSRKKKNPLSQQDKRKLSALSHYKFREILKYQGKKYGSTVQEVNEYMTTKTCSTCEKKYNIGRSRVYECPNRDCGMIADRDINAAKNIRYKEPKQEKKGRKKISPYRKRKPRQKPQPKSKTARTEK